MTEITQDQASQRRSPHPLIFISHDSRDAVLAEAFCRLLSSVSMGVLRTFRSSDNKGAQGIQYGVDWYPEIMSKLDEATDVVCLITSTSLGRPWLLYEAGVAKGQKRTTVYGVAIGISLADANIGPFAQFQNCSDDVDSLTKLIIQLAGRIDGANPDRDAVQMQVEIFKSKAMEFLNKDHGSQVDNSDGDSEGDSIAHIYEDMKSMIKELPALIDSRVNKNYPLNNKKRSKYSASFAHEMFYSYREEDNRLALVSVAAIIKEDVPWIYDLSLDAYRSMINPGRNFMAQSKDQSSKPIPPVAVRALYRALHDLSSGAKIISYPIIETNDIFEIIFTLRNMLEYSYENMDRFLSERTLFK